MSDIIKNIVAGEICTIQISVAKYDEATGLKTYGTTNVNLTAKDIYVDIYSDDSETPVLSKNRVSNASTTGVTLDEDSATKSNLLIAFSAADYAGNFSTVQPKRHFTMRVRYKLLSTGVVTDEKSIYPYTNEKGILVNYNINLIKKLQT